MKLTPSNKTFISAIMGKVSDIIGGQNGRSTVNSSLSNNALVDKNSGLYIEHYFNERLCFERKRSERSKNPFILMLLELKECLTREDRIIRDITSVLISSTRETDIKGWYRHYSIIGVIFTEIRNMDINSIEQKYYRKLCDVSGPSDVRNFKISLHVFPEQDRNSDNIPDLHFYPEVTKKGTDRRSRLSLKRIIDIGGGIAGFIVFSPFFLIVPLIIKHTSEGPILFRQERIGLNGEKFIMYKFRSMYINNDSTIHREYVRSLINGQIGHGNKERGTAEKGLFKIANDSRITPIGRFLRKTSLDELPQFINVITGDMSLVGPRPPLEYELDNYDTWHRRRILAVKPGVTGLWQVKGRSRTTFDEMVRMDIKYTRERSLWLDLVLLFRTVRVVLNGKGAC